MTDQHVDILVVGAGLSGIDAGYRIQTRTAGKTYAILEGRDSIGGTWDLFRYPGVRSDSDMFTLGYPFRPWTNPDSISDGASILDYIRETAAAYGIDRHVRFGHRVVRAAWSSDDSRWTVEAEVGRERRPTTWTCSFLYLCCGYYSYAGGHEVDFPGRGDFGGRVVHPQQWPADLDHRGRRVVVIGSGATAVTLVPALAREAAHVTMVQRSPGYIVSRPTRDAFADRVRALLPTGPAHRVVRAKNVLLGQLAYQYLRRRPRQAARMIEAGVARGLAGTVPTDPHFRPRYDPWDQRLCLVPDGDFFHALRSRRADVVTGQVEAFSPTGIRMATGEEIPADIVVTATGLRMVALGEMSLTVDGRPVDPAQCLVYKGMMLSGVPNLAWCVGYSNASWTLRADLTAQYVCRLVNHLDRYGWTRCVPEAPDSGGAGSAPILDLTSGYVQRAARYLPKQGVRRPWRLRQNYLLDAADMRLGRVADGTMRFSGRVATPQRASSTV
jgi:cation diffusion facilitator CzcD-associated flavoprotein CzcO